MSSEGVKDDKYVIDVDDVLESNAAATAQEARVDATTALMAEFCRGT
jgi:hypothetical protein